MELQRAFLDWLVQEIAKALAGEEVSEPVHIHTTLTPGAGGQASTGPAGTLRTARQANLLPRPLTPLTATRVNGRDQALGDTNRATRPIEPAPRQPGIPPLRYPWVAPYPVDTPTQREVTIDAPTERFAGLLVPTLTYAWPGTDGWFRFLGDPDAAYPLRYAGYASPGAGADSETNPRFIGPNWFFPFGVQQVAGAARTFALHIPVFDGLPYYRNDPDAFVGGIQSFAPNAATTPGPYQLARSMHNADALGSDYAIPRFQPGPLEPDSLGGWTYDLDFGWPISIYRDAIFTAFSPASILVADTVHLYADAGVATPFSSQAWRYTFTPGAALDGHTFTIDSALLDYDNHPAGSTVPDDWSHIWCIGTGAPPLADEGTRPYTPGVWHRRNFMDPDDTDVPSWFIAEGTIGPTVMKAIIDVRFEADPNTGFIELTARIGYVAYAETAWTMGTVLTQNGTWSGVGYALGGTNRSTPEPAFIGPEAQHYDTDHIFRDVADGNWGNTTLRLTTIGNTETPAGLKLWWSQSQADMETRPGWRDSGRRLGIEHDWVGIGHEEVARTYNGQVAPTVPTVGRFAWGDFGPASVPQGLRMSHQEHFTDLNGTDEKIIGRILTLIDAATLRCFFPPSDPAPHDNGWPLDTMHATVFDTFAASVGHHLEHATLGNIPMPHAGTPATFAGLEIDATTTLAADALTDPAGRILALVVAADRTCRISVDDVEAWSGTLAALVGPGAAADIPAAAAPIPHARFLHPHWPTRTLVIHLADQRLVFRLRTQDDVVGPRAAPLAFSHFGTDDGD